MRRAKSELSIKNIIELRKIVIIAHENNQIMLPLYRKGIIDTCYYCDKLTYASKCRIEYILNKIYAGDFSMINLTKSPVYL